MCSQETHSPSQTFSCRQLANAILAWLVLWSPWVLSADWNATRIDWHEYAAGMRHAQSSGKPVMLIIHSDGCGACRQYAELFFNAETVEASAGLVMVLVDDGDEEVSSRYAFDGSYVPRTYFLSAEGEHLDIRLGTADPTFLYYYGSRKPDGLVNAMQEAASRVTTPAPVDADSADK